MKILHRTGIIAIVVLATLALVPATASATPVVAEYDVLQIPFTGSLDNPCSGETVQFDGYFNFRYRVLNISTYVELVQNISYATYSVTAVGQTTGAVYQVMQRSSGIMYEQGANITLTSTSIFQVMGAGTHFVTRYAVHLEVVDGKVIGAGTFLDATCI